LEDDEEVLSEDFEVQSDEPEAPAMDFEGMSSGDFAAYLEARAAGEAIQNGEPIGTFVPTDEQALGVAEEAQSEEKAKEALIFAKAYQKFRREAVQELVADREDGSEDDYREPVDYSPEAMTSSEFQKALAEAMGRFPALQQDGVTGD
jgi:hypothetical protein